MACMVLALMMPVTARSIPVSTNVLVKIKICCVQSVRQLRVAAPAVFIVVGGGKGNSGGGGV